MCMIYVHKLCDTGFLNLNNIIFTITNYNMQSKELFSGTLNLFYHTAALRLLAGLLCFLIHGH